jgi:hypothetical protein
MLSAGQGMAYGYGGIKGEKLGSEWFAGRALPPSPTGG